MPRSKDSFFKFMRFGPHTRLSMYMLLKHKALFFAHKGVLNDPTDCSPYFYVEISGSALERRVEEIADESASENPVTLREAKDVLEILKKDREGSAKSDSSSLKIRHSSRLFSFGYFARESAEEIAKRFVAHHMESHVNHARVFSMSKIWQEPRLWAHYSESHSGMSIELTGLDDPPSGLIFDRVEYTTKRPSISVSEIQNMRKNDQVRREVYGRMFFQKSMGWEYEREYRLVMPTDNLVNVGKPLHLPEGQYVTFPKLRIKAIYFGLNCSPTNFEMIESLIDQFIDKKNQPKFAFTTQNNNSYELEATFENPYVIPF